MPFETYSYDLNRDLGGGFPDQGLSLIAGAPGSGKTLLAIDVVARYLRSPASKNVVVVGTELAKWRTAIRDRSLSARTILSQSLQGVVNLDPALLVILGTVTDRAVLVGERSYLFEQVTSKSFATFILTSLIRNSPPQRFRVILEMKERSGTYEGRVHQSLTGQRGSHNLTRCEYSATDTALDMLLSDDDLV